MGTGNPRLPLDGMRRSVESGEDGDATSACLIVINVKRELCRDYPDHNRRETMTNSLSRVVLSVVPFAVAVTACAGVAAAEPHPERVSQSVPSPLLGTWELDLKRMPDTYGTPPKRVIYTFEDMGSGKWRTTIDITAPDGSVRHTTVSYIPDGKAVRGEGDTGEADSAAVVAPAPNVLIMNLAKEKIKGSVRVYTVSSDGKELIESAANVDDEGNPFIRQFHLKRVR